MRFLFCLLLFTNLLRGQDIPPVVAFSPETYGNGSQTWALSQGTEGFIYAANNSGLLEYDGSRWMTYPTPAILRAVYATGNRVYTGSYMDFGYWERGKNGRLEYTSLANRNAGQVQTDEQFWRILPRGERVLFQSLQQFFLYDPAKERLTVLTPDNGILRTLPTRRNVFFQDGTRRLFRLVAGRSEAMLGGNPFPYPVISMWEEGGRLLLQTAENGCFILTDDGFTAIARHAFLRGRKVYAALRLRNGGHAFGTVSAGLFVTDAEGQRRLHLDRERGLSNNTVLALSEDVSGNIWAGTDHGINVVNLLSPIRRFTDPSGRIGAVYAAAHHEGRLYLGTNQGLFFRPVVSEEAFTLVPGTRGQVWGLLKYGKDLFVGHDNGTFLVKGRGPRQSTGRARRCEAVTGGATVGTWLFLPVPGRPELLLRGTYAGLDVLERGDNGWRVRNHVEGFDLSARFLASPVPGEVCVSHEYRGVYGLRLDEDYRRVVDSVKFSSPQKGQHAGLVTYEDRVYYLNADGLYVLNSLTEGWHRDTTLNTMIAPEDYLSGKLTAATDRLWFFDRRSISNLYRAPLSGELRRQTIPIAAASVAAKAGFENLTALGQDTLLIGTSDGYLRLALDAIPLPRHEVLLREVSGRLVRDSTFTLPLAPASAPKIPYTANSLTFRWAVPHYALYFRPAFQYRLLGQSDEWSEWTEDAVVTFPRLSPGSYELEVRSRLNRRESENVLRYAFTIMPPWYARTPAYLIYVTLLALSGYLLHLLYTRHYRRKAALAARENERLAVARTRENELAITRMRNEQLRQEMEGRTREAASRTMSLAKQNEILLRIKEELERKSVAPQVRIEAVQATIAENLDENASWELFREAFETTDRQFFSRMRELHPGLTTNDLKLCAYLRLNLSTKEIAPLLHISPRSVEVKRYRLRKKLDLQRGQDLVSYIAGV